MKRLQAPLSLLAVGVTVAALAHCEPPPGLDEYCPDDPLREWCNTDHNCSGPFECVSYCIRLYPGGSGVPSSGMGS